MNPENRPSTAGLNLLHVGTRLASKLEPDPLLSEILDVAREATGARYAALGILDEDRAALAGFVTAGLSAEELQQLGDPPQGHGILGLLIERPEALRLHDVSQHPRSYGFPAGHPPMKSFLGVPIVIDGRPWGNLYLTDKHGAEDFDDADVEAIQAIAGWAAIAITNAHRFNEVTGRERELARELRAYRSTLEVTKAIGPDTDLERVLGLIVKRARALIDADSVLLWLQSGADLELVATAGAAQAGIGARLPLERSPAGDVLLDGRPRRLAADEDLRNCPLPDGLERAKTALVVPLAHRTQRHGVLMAFDQQGAGRRFDDDAQRVLDTFAATVSVAVTNARSARDAPRQDGSAATRRERHRWSGVLTDKTLRGLADLRLSLTRSLDGDPGEARDVVADAVRRLDETIRDLEGIIADVRPSSR